MRSRPARTSKAKAKKPPEVEAPASEQPLPPAANPVVDVPVVPPAASALAGAGAVSGLVLRRGPPEALCPGWG